MEDGLIVSRGGGGKGGRKEAGDGEDAGRRESSRFHAQKTGGRRERERWA